MPVGRVALLSTAACAHLDDDLQPLMAALGELDVDVQVADWHDRSVDWRAFDLVVIRSPWDYTEDLDGFLAALERIDAQTRLANPLPVVRANADKRYLLRLADAGVPVVPTTVFAPGDELRLPAGAAVVVKPAVSAGAKDTERHGPDEHAAAHIHAAALLAAGRHVLVQPYVERVDVDGETGLVFLGGELSHAIRKGPLLSGDVPFVEGLYREEQIAPRVPSPAERAMAERILDVLSVVAPGYRQDDLLYARVDLVPGPTGLLLMELELIEPSLFLASSEGAAARAAHAIVQAMLRNASPQRAPGTQAPEEWSG